MERWTEERLDDLTLILSLASMYAAMAGLIATLVVTQL